MGWIKQAVVNLTAVVAVVGSAASADAQAKPATAPAAPRVAKSAYWDKPLVLPPSVDSLLPKLPAPVAQWVITWKANELAGKSATDEQIAELNQLINDLPTPVDYLAPLVAIIADLDGNKAALPLCDSVLNRGETELKPFPKGDPALQPAVEALWLLHPVLWDSQQYASDQKLLELVRPWEVYGSAHSQWATFVKAEGLYLEGEYDRAYEAFRLAESERTASFEPSEGLNRSLAWEVGLSLWGAGRLSEAIPYLREVANSAQGEDSRIALRLLVCALAASGEDRTAETAYSQYLQKYHPSASEALEMAAAVAVARTRSLPADK